MKPTYLAFLGLAAVAVVTVASCSKDDARPPAQQPPAGTTAEPVAGNGERIAVPGGTPVPASGERIAVPGAVAPPGIGSAAAGGGAAGSGAVAGSAPRGTSASGTESTGTEGTGFAAAGGATKSSGGGGHSADARSGSGSPATPAGDLAVADSADASYSVSVDAPATGTANTALTARVHVTPGKGFKMNPDFPTSLTVTAPAGVTVAKPKLAKADAEKLDAHELVFAVELTPTSAGDKQLRAQLKFAVCTDVTCDPKTKDLAWAVAVK